MSFQAPHVSEHLSVSSVIFGRTSDVPANSAHWQIWNMTGHIRVAASEQITWEVISLSFAFWIIHVSSTPFNTHFRYDLIQSMN